MEHLLTLNVSRLDSQNSRVLKWILERCEGTAGAVESPIGYVPKPSDIDLSGIEIPAADMETVLSVDPVGYLEEVVQIREYHAKMGDRYPAGVKAQVDALEQRLKAAVKA